MRAQLVAPLGIRGRERRRRRGRDRGARLARRSSRTRGAPPHRRRRDGDERAHLGGLPAGLGLDGRPSLLHSAGAAPCRGGGARDRARRRTIGPRLGAVRRSPSSPRGCPRSGATASRSPPTRTTIGRGSRRTSAPSRVDHRPDRAGGPRGDLRRRDRAVPDRAPTIDLGGLNDAVIAGHLRHRELAPPRTTSSRRSPRYSCWPTPPDLRPRPAPRLRACGRATNRSS